METTEATQKLGPSFAKEEPRPYNFAFAVGV